MDNSTRPSRLWVRDRRHRRRSASNSLGTRRARRGRPAAQARAPPRPAPTSRSRTRSAPACAGVGRALARRAGRARSADRPAELRRAAPRSACAPRAARRRRRRRTRRPARAARRRRADVSASRSTSARSRSRVDSASSGSARAVGAPPICVVVTITSCRPSSARLAACERLLLRRLVGGHLRLELRERVLGTVGRRCRPAQRRAASRRASAPRRPRRASPRRPRSRSPRESIRSSARLNLSHTDDVVAERVAAGRARRRDLRRERALAELQHLELGLELLAALVELDRVARGLVLVALDLRDLGLGGLLLASATSRASSSPALAPRSSRASPTRRPSPCTSRCRCSSCFAVVLYETSSASAFLRPSSSSRIAMSSSFSGSIALSSAAFALLEMPLLIREKMPMRRILAPIPCRGRTCGSAGGTGRR